jgi:hypothetical protein
MQTKYILVIFSLFSNISSLALPKRSRKGRDVELRNGNDDVILNKRFPKQNRKGRENELRNGNDD